MCSDGHGAGPGFTCATCGSGIGILPIIIVALLALVAAVLFVYKDRVHKAVTNEVDKRTLQIARRMTSIGGKADELDEGGEDAREQKAKEQMRAFWAKVKILFVT